MALSFSIAQRCKIDNMFLNIVNVTLDNAYPTGGEAISASNVGLSTISALIPLGSVGGATYEWIPSTSKLKAYYADYDAGADGLLIEVTTGSSLLDTFVVPVMAIGF